MVWQLSWASRESGENFWNIIIIIIILLLLLLLLLRETDHAGRINERMRGSHRHPQGSESQTNQKSVSRLGIEPRSSDLRSDALAD